jgi:predicted NBD/HSP70 family sugar kinase
MHLQFEPHPGVLAARASIAATIAAFIGRSCPFAIRIGSDAGPAAFVALLRRESDAMLARAGGDARSVGAVGCAVPGQVDGDGLVIGAGNLDGWDRVPLRTLLGEEWLAPAFVDQDANAGALGEMWRGAARTMRDFVFVALGTASGWASSSAGASIAALTTPPASWATSPSG